MPVRGRETRPAQWSVVLLEVLEQTQTCPSVGVKQFDAVFDDLITPPRIAFVGLGGMGRRHLQIASDLLDLHDTLKHTARIAAYDPFKQSLRQHIPAHITMRPSFDPIGWRSVHDLAAWEPTHVVVALEPRDHTTYVRDLLSYTTAHILCDKPLGIPQAECEHWWYNPDHRITVGYQWRFDRAVRQLCVDVRDGKYGEVLTSRFQFGSYLPSWRPSRDYRNTYSADITRGGGVLMDASHEIDLALWFMGTLPDRVFAHVLVPTDDELLAVTEGTDIAADLLLSYPTASAYVHVDYLAPAYRRSITVYGTEGDKHLELVPGQEMYDLQMYTWIAAAGTTHANDESPAHRIGACSVKEAAAVGLVALNARQQGQRVLMLTDDDAAS